MNGFIRPRCSKAENFGKALIIEKIVLPTSAEDWIVVEVVDCVPPEAAHRIAEAARAGVRSREEIEKRKTGPRQKVDVAGLGEARCLKLAIHLVSRAEVIGQKSRGGER